MMSGNDEEEEYNIINGEISAPKQSYYKHQKQGTNYSKRVQKELNNTELKFNINSLALELGKQKAINKPLLKKMAKLVLKDQEKEHCKRHIIVYNRLNIFLKIIR